MDIRKNTCFEHSYNLREFWCFFFKGIFTTPPPQATSVFEIDNVQVIRKVVNLKENH